MSPRWPAAEEFVTQETSLVTGIQGRPLNAAEIALARSGLPGVKDATIFGDSIDYERVRLLPSDNPILVYRTVGNVIRIPSDFTVTQSSTPTRDPVSYMQQTFIHEMTHVWQYQHEGTSYLSYSVDAQAAAGIRTWGRSREGAYDYKPDSAKTFFDFPPEQQGMIVEDYYVMLRRGQAPPPIYETYLSQMRSAMPEPEPRLLMQRSRDVIQMPGAGIGIIPPGKEMTPVRPLFEMHF
jgi:hypothetical protein